MVKHRRLAHGAKTFICTICEKGFTSIFALNKHLNVHSGLKPFKCIDCDYRWAVLSLFLFISNVRMRSDLRPLNEFVTLSILHHLDKKADLGKYLLLMKWCSLVEGDEGLFLPNCQSNLAIALSL